MVTPFIKLLDGTKTPEHARPAIDIKLLAPKEVSATTVSLLKIQKIECSIKPSQINHSTLLPIGTTAAFSTPIMTYKVQGGSPAKRKGKEREKEPKRARMKDISGGKGRNESREEEEIDFRSLLGTGDGVTGNGITVEENGTIEAEKRFDALRRAWRGNEETTRQGGPQWEPPKDLLPVNRKQIVAPALKPSSNDILVSDIAVTADQSFPTFSLTTENDDTVRLSSSYAKGTPNTHLLFLLAPSGFDERRRFSYETRWENLNTRLNSIQVDTLRSYERHVTKYLEFCEDEGVEAKNRFPADPQVVNNWVGKSSRKYSSGYLRSWFNAIEFWHELHEISFHLDKKIKDRTINGAKRIAPAARPLRRGLTIEDLIIIVESLDKETTLHPRKKSVNTSIKAAALFLLFAMGRSKDALVPRRTQEKGISRKDKRIEAERKAQGQRLGTKPRTEITFSTSYDVHGGCFEYHEATEDMPAVYSVHIPWDKKKHKAGETVQLAEQTAIDPRICPVQALLEHLRINKPSSNEPAFSYFGDKNQRLWLTTSWFTGRINQALLESGKDKIHGHSFREGGATFYTKAGVDPEITRACGRWAGKENYQIYLREKAQIAGRHLANLELERRRTSAPSKTTKKSGRKPAVEVLTDDETDGDEDYGEDGSE